MPFPMSKPTWLDDHYRRIEQAEKKKKAVPDEKRWERLSRKDFMERMAKDGHVRKETDGGEKVQRNVDAGAGEES